MTVEAVVAAKRALRAELRARRAALGAAARERASAGIAERLRAHRWWAAARTVALFRSLPEEVDTAALIAAARAEGRRVALPVSVGRGRPLVLRDATDPGTPFAVGAFGVLEPTGTAEVPAATVDLWVVPGLAFDRGGRRLGYGAGFYDRTLAGSRAPRVMVAFAVQAVDRVPTDPFDLAMDAVATEAEWVAVTG